MLKNILETIQTIDKKIIHCMCCACWITQTTDIHSEFVTLIAFPRQWLRERSLVLRYTYEYIACLIICNINEHLPSASYSFSR
jgi:hypothetical protein